MLLQLQPCFSSLLARFSYGKEVHVSCYLVSKIIYILTYRSLLIICQVGAETAWVVNCYAETDFMNMLKWDGVNIYGYLYISIFNVFVYFMCNLYFMGADRGERILWDVLCQRQYVNKQMFADLSLFLLRRFVNERFNEQESFSFIITLCSVAIFVWKGISVYIFIMQRAEGCHKLRKL